MGTPPRGDDISASTRTHSACLCIQKELGSAVFAGGYIDCQWMHINLFVKNLFVKNMSLVIKKKKNDGQNQPTYNTECHPTNCVPLTSLCVLAIFLSRGWRMSNTKVFAEH